MAVQVFYCSIEPLRDENLFDHYHSRLPDSRRQRIAQLRVPEDRLRSLGAGLMLHCALNALNVPMHLRRVERLANGKPILADLPLHISLSHSGPAALCAISDCPVGVDAQTPKTPKKALLQRVCSDAELAWLSARDNSAVDFAALWTRKESLLKAMGRTIAEDLRQLSCLGDVLDALDLRWQFSERRLFDIPVCVCCVEGSEVIWHEIDPAREEIQNSFDSLSQF